MEKKDHKSIEVIDEDGKRPPQQQQQRPPPCPGLSGERGGRRQQMQHAPAQHVYHLIVDGVRLEEVIHSPQCIWTYQYNGAPFGDIIRKRKMVFPAINDDIKLFKKSTTYEGCKTSLLASTEIWKQHKFC